MKVSEFSKIAGVSGKEFCRIHNIKYIRLVKDLARNYCNLRPFCPVNHELNSTYNSIRTRCYEKNYHQYKDYGGRGIKMSGEFFYSFKAFAEYMGEKPGPEYTIDRIDNDGNYERGNLRWATRHQQAINRRRCNSVGYRNIRNVNNRFRVCLHYHDKFYGGGTYSCINNAIASREILKYRLENGMYS